MCVTLLSLVTKYNEKSESIENMGAELPEILFE